MTRDSGIGYGEKWQTDMTQLRLSGIRACVFDAYGTLFDVNSAATQAKDALGERWQPLADTWRAKQLQYT
jgi:2-haloacid dehalogenase